MGQVVWYDGEVVRKSLSRKRLTGIYGTSDIAVLPEKEFFPQA